MPEEIEKKQKRFFKEKISRYRPIVFIRKNIYVFSFISLFSLSLLFGFWNIKKYEIYDITGSTVDENVKQDIDKYFDENIQGQNYFMLSPTELREKMYLDISYVKSVRIEKVVPNKLIFFFEIYSPQYVAKIAEKNCYILSNEGIVLEQLCLEGDDECCKQVSLEKKLPFVLSSDIDISFFEDQKDRLLIMEDINKIYTVISSFKYVITDITLDDEVLELSDEQGKIFRFNINDDVQLQIKRYISVMKKIRSDGMEFNSLDMRFERPVMKI